MTTWLLVALCGVCFTAAVAAVVVALVERRRSRCTLETLDQMLDAAMDGSFQESCFDESMLSAVETKLARYLADSTVSERNLREEKDRIKELVADISHQTKTPIANILLYSQLLQEQDLPDEARRIAEPLDAQAEKLSFLIQSLVKTSRLETGVFALHPEKASIAELVDAAVAHVRPQAESKGIELVVSVPLEVELAAGTGVATSIEAKAGGKAGVGTEGDADTGTRANASAEQEARANTETRTDAEARECGGNVLSAFFDPKWTEEALFNLLDNAVKYTPKGGRICVSTECYELFCRIDVTDTGIGIAEEELAAIFSRFYRSPSVAQDKGVGVGLYLARQIATTEGGYLKVASKLGEGSTFSLFLPCEV